MDSYNKIGITSALIPNKETIFYNEISLMIRPNPVGQFVTRLQIILTLTNGRSKIYREVFIRFVINETHFTSVQAVLQI